MVRCSNRARAFEKVDIFKIDKSQGWVWELLSTGQKTSKTGFLCKPIHTGLAFTGEEIKVKAKYRFFTLPIDRVIRVGRK